MYPPLLNTLSDLTLVAGIDKYFLASFAVTGKKGISTYLFLLWLFTKTNSENCFNSRVTMRELIRIMRSYHLILLERVSIINWIEF